MMMSYQSTIWRLQERVDAGRHRGSTGAVAHRLWGAKEPEKTGVSVGKTHGGTGVPPNGVHSSH